MDNNAAKTLALDHLGVIAARLVTSSLKFNNPGEEGLLKNLDEVFVWNHEVNDTDKLAQIIAKTERKQLKRLIEVHNDVSSHLSKRASEDQACDVCLPLVCLR